jgi:hypothetical protein
VLEKLRGPHSLGHLLIFLGIAVIVQAAHAVEHVVQTLQVFVFAMPREEAGGVLGSMLDFPWVHFTYNFVFFVGLLWAVAWAYGLGGFRRLDSIGMWALIVGATVQTYHTAEHVIQIAQQLEVGTNRPPGFIGSFQDNVLIHLELGVAGLVFPLVSLVRFGGIGVMKRWIAEHRVTVPAAA